MRKSLLVVVAVVGATLAFTAGAALAVNDQGAFGRAVQPGQNAPIMSESTGDYTAAAVVQGEVTQKFMSQNGTLIAVDGALYSVSGSFFNSVQVGDTVSFDGTNWTITGHKSTWQ